MINKIKTLTWLPHHHFTEKLIRSAVDVGSVSLAAVRDPDTGGTQYFLGTDFCIKTLWQDLFCRRGQRFFCFNVQIGKNLSFFLSLVFVFFKFGFKARQQKTKLYIFYFETEIPKKEPYTDYFVFIYFYIFWSHL